MLKDEFESTSPKTSVDEALATNTHAPVLLKAILQMDRHAFNPRSAIDSSRSISDLQKTKRATHPSGAAADITITSDKTNTKLGEEDEIPDHLKHLFRHEPIVQIESVSTGLFLNLTLHFFIEKDLIVD
jgi:hypothetical protein